MKYTIYKGCNIFLKIKITWDYILNGTDGFISIPKYFTLTVEISFLYIVQGRSIKVYYYVRKANILLIWAKSQRQLSKGPNKEALKSLLHESNENTGKNGPNKTFLKIWMINKGLQ